MTNIANGFCKLWKPMRAMAMKAADAMLTRINRKTKKTKRNTKRVLCLLIALIVSFFFVISHHPLSSYFDYFDNLRSKIFTSTPTTTTTTNQHDAMQEDNLTLTIKLLASFVENSLDYLKLFVPLLIVYKLCMRNHHKRQQQQQHEQQYADPIRPRNFFAWLLHMFAFGTRDGPRAASADQEKLLPATKKDLINDNNEHLHSTKQPASVAKPLFSRTLCFVVCFVGLQVSFLLWGIMQERILKFGYKETSSSSLANEMTSTNMTGTAARTKMNKFKNSQFLVLSNRLFGLLLSSFVLLVCNTHAFRRRTANSFDSIVSCRNWPPLFICSYSSLSNVVSSWCQYESLKYVSFTSQQLAKSSKSVFVMFTGWLVSGKRYKGNEYVSVFLISVGIFVFSDIQDLTSPDAATKGTTVPGLVCLLGYLISDSFTSTWQDNLLTEYKMSSIALMFTTNLYSCAYTLVSLVSQGQLLDTFAFLREHSDILGHVLLLSATSAIGQIFIFVTIQNFGALIFSLIMTTRQVLSILLSFVVFENYLPLRSGIGLAIIFAALFMQQYFKFTTMKSRGGKSAAAAAAAAPALASVKRPGGDGASGAGLNDSHESVKDSNNNNESRKIILENHLV